MFNTKHALRLYKACIKINESEEMKSINIEPHYSFKHPLFLRAFSKIQNQLPNALLYSSSTNVPFSHNCPH